MSKVLAILGSGHLGQQIAHFAINDHHYKKIVFFDDFSTEATINKIEILGTSESIIKEFKNKKFDEILIGIGYKHLDKRKFYYEQFKNRIPFGKIVHSSAWVDYSAKIMDGCIIYPCCCIDANSSIDSNTILNLSCVIAHDTKVGKHCFLAPNVSLAGFVQIGEKCVLGISTTVIDGIKIVANTLTGASTVVINNIVKSGVYVGNPQRLIVKQ